MPKPPKSLLPYTNAQWDWVAARYREGYRIKELERLIRAHKILHVHNTCARWCFGNARCYVDGNENQKLMKDRSFGRIDIIVAWVIALATATVMRNQKLDLAAAMSRPGFSL